jgi:tetratricopeptide (TPR) repeat protein
MDEGFFLVIPRYDDILMMKNIPSSTRSDNASHCQRIAHSPCIEARSNFLFGESTGNANTHVFANRITTGILGRDRCHHFCRGVCRAHRCNIHSRSVWSRHLANGRFRLANSSYIPVSMRISRVIIALVVLMLPVVLPAQLDSLRNELNKAKADTTKIRLCIAIAAQQTNNNLDTTLAYCDRAESLARKTNNRKGIADAQYQRAYAVFYAGDGDSSLRMYDKLIGEYRALGDSGSVAACYNKAGFIYREKGDRLEALKQYELALNANVNNQDVIEAAGSYLNIGLIHHDQGDVAQALKYQLQALALYEQTNDISKTCNALLRIGNVYCDMQDDTTGLIYYQRALDLGQQIPSKRHVAIALNNMASIYSRWKDPSRAIALWRQALQMRREIGDLNGASLILNNMGLEYTSMQVYDSAFYYINESYILTDSIGYKEMNMSNCKAFAELYAAQGEHEKAYDWFRRYHAIFADINAEESKNEVSRLSALLKAEESANQIEQLSQQKKLDEAALDQEKTKGWFLGIVLLGVALIAVVIWLNNRKTKRTNVILETQKHEIAEQKKIVEEQHRDIVDSVNYALRIQQAVLPSRNEMKCIFPESFMVYKPRDIVSGDFWWIAEKAGVKVIAVADCTGHGVPGAFMSLIGTSLLNEIINEKSITDPGIALNLLSDKVMKALHQHEDRVSAHDGMDIALAVIDENADLLMFAGANNSLYYTTIDGELKEIKGDRQPIGFYVDKHQPFKVHTVSLADITNIYMLTDGYADQFCGNAGTQFGKKFKYSRLKKTLSDIQGLNTLQQKEHLQQTFEDWKGNMFQVDDVLVLGIRFY